MTSPTNPPPSGPSDPLGDDPQMAQDAAASDSASDTDTTPGPIRLIQIADDQSTDTAIVRLIATGETELIPLFTYLVAEATPNPFSCR